MTTAVIRNGVNVDQLVQTVQAIQDLPDLARFEFRAHTAWKAGGRSETTVRGFCGAGQEDSSRSQPLIMMGDERPFLITHIARVWSADRCAQYISDESA